MKRLAVLATVSVIITLTVPAATAATTGSISGHITSVADGSPVTDGWVRVINAADPHLDLSTFNTDGSGLFTATNLPAGDYYVEAGSFGDVLALEWYPNRPSFDGAQTVAVAAGQQTPLSIALEVGGTISGAITDETGSPVAGIKVAAHHKSGDVFGQNPSYGQDGSDLTATDGTYSITALGAQDYRVRIAESSAYVEEFFNDRTSLATADPVSVSLGTTTSGIDAVLTMGGTIEGTITDRVTGAPIPGLSVLAYTRVGPAEIRIGDLDTTAADGSYRLEGLATDGFIVAVEDLQKNVYAMSYHGGDSETTAVPVPVAAGEMTRLDLTATLRFADANTSVFREDIKWLAIEGITSGCTADSFCTNKAVTRSQMAAFLSRALDLPVTTTNYFSDDDSSIFEGDINRVAAAGTTLGCNPPANDNYCPDKSVTRGQMAAFLVRALGYSDTGTGNLFTDDDGSVFELDIARLATAGVTRGCNPPANDQFCPGKSVSRGQMAAFLHRALG